MSDSAKAVFLSYASQDADAARRICEALRAAGIEVWFDQSELRGGDAWDQKIRRQIKECALFVPIITANTNARPEGYFRLEWKLAVDRSHLLADDHPFLFPIALGEVSDATARVPDKFREVQWTRLRLDETLSELAARVARLLTGEAPTAARDPATRGRATSLWSWWTRRRERRPAWLRHATAAVGLVLVLVYGLRPLWQSDRGKPADGDRTADKSAAAPGSSEAATLAAEAKTHYEGIFTRDDLLLAGDLGRRATELAPSLALAWAVRAGAQANFLMRGFAAGEEALQRAREAQSSANRALALDPNQVEALLALGQVAMYQNTPDQAEAFYRRVLALEPGNIFARRFLSIVLRQTGRVAEAVAVMQDAVRRASGDALAHFDLALAYAWGWNWPLAWREADATLARQPFPGALLLKAQLALRGQGDLALMRKLVEQIDVTKRGEDESVATDAWCGLLAHEPDRVFAAVGRTARDYLEESLFFQGPKAWFAAEADQISGRANLADQQWQAAADVLRARLQTDPQNPVLHLQLADTLAWLGRSDETRREAGPVEAVWREQMTPVRAGQLAGYYAAAGDAPHAVACLHQAVNAGAGINALTPEILKLDPWWNRIRAAPEFQELLAHPPPAPAAIASTSTAIP